MYILILLHIRVYNVYMHLMDRVAIIMTPYIQNAVMHVRYCTLTYQSIEIHHSYHVKINRKYRVIFKINFLHSLYYTFKYTQLLSTQTYMTLIFRVQSKKGKMYYGLMFSKKRSKCVVLRIEGQKRVLGKAMCR